MASGAPAARGQGLRGHLWAGGSGGDDSGDGHLLTACGPGCRQNSVFCPQRSPLPPSGAGLQQQGQSGRVPCGRRDPALSEHLMRTGNCAAPCAASVALPDPFSGAWRLAGPKRSPRCPQGCKAAARSPDTGRVSCQHPAACCGGTRPPRHQGVT